MTCRVVPVINDSNYLYCDTRRLFASYYSDEAAAVLVVWRHDLSSSGVSLVLAKSVAFSSGVEKHWPYLSPTTAWQK